MGHIMLWSDLYYPSASGVSLSYPSPSFIGWGTY